MNSDANLASLVDISAISIDPALPKEEKISSFVRQTNYSPCRFASGKYDIDAEFDDNAPTLENSYKRFTQATNSTFLIDGIIIGGEKGKMNIAQPAP